MSKKILFAVFLSLFILPPYIKAFAQEGPSIGYAQEGEYKYLSLQPGSELKGTFTVWNLKQETTTYFVYISGFEQVEDYPGTARPLPPEEDIKDPYSASAWFSVDIDKLDLEPHTNVDIAFRVQVPEDIALGEYHAKIFLSTMNPDNIISDEEESMAFSNLSSGPDFLIQIGNTEDLTEEMDLLKFTTDRAIYEKPIVTLLTEIENTGNTHVKPMGDIIIRNFLNNEVARFPVNPNEASTLRGETSKYRTIWSINRQVLSEDNKLIVGPMRAELVATYKTENPGFYPILSETSFWIIPWKILLAIIAAIVLISIGLKVRKEGSSKKNAKTS